MIKLSGNIKKIFRKKEEEAEAATVVFLESEEKAENTQKLDEEKNQIRVKHLRTSTKPKSKKSVGKPVDDSVVEDVGKFRDFASRSLKLIEGKVGPVVFRFVKPLFLYLSNLAVAVSGAVGTKLVKKVAVFLAVAIAIVVIVIVGTKGVGIIMQNGDEDESKMEPTPTPVSYQPYRPSLYAQDPEIIKLQEDVNVLKRELSNTNIRETILNPPNLEYGVRF